MRCAAKSMRPRWVRADPLPECGGRMTWHHVLPRQLLKREYPHGAYTGPDGRVVEAAPRGGRDPSRAGWVPVSKLIADTRNRVFLCNDHHGLIENKRFYIPRGELPASVEDFARDLGLLWWLDDYYGEARAS